MDSKNNNKLRSSSNKKQHSPSASMQENDSYNIYSTRNESSTENPYSSINFPFLVKIEENLLALLEHFRSSKIFKMQYCIDYYITFTKSNLGTECIFHNPFHCAIINQSLKLQVISVYVAIHLMSYKGYDISSQVGYLLKNLIYEIHQNFLIFMQVLLNQMAKDRYANLCNNKIQKIIYDRMTQRIGKSDLVSLIKKNNSNIIISIKGALVNENKSLGSLLRKVDVLDCNQYVHFLKKKIEAKTVLPIILDDEQNENEKGNKSFETLTIPFLRSIIDKSKVLTVVLDLDETMVSFKMVMISDLI